MYMCVSVCVCMCMYVCMCILNRATVHTVGEGWRREVFLIELQYIQWVRGGGREVFLKELQYIQRVRGGGRYS